jgi:mono/diheme cytochrome c family protein
VQQGSGYASTIGIALSRINPGITLVDLDSRGAPNLDYTRTAFIAGFALESNSDSTSIVRSYPSSVNFSPGGDVMYATMEASAQVVALSTTTVFGSEALCNDCDRASDTGSLTPSQGGFTQAPSVFISTGWGPRGVAFVDEDNAFVHNFADRNVASLGAGEAANSIQDQFQNGVTSQVTQRASTGHTLADASLDPQVDLGRRLFYSATTPQMAASGSGVSCATCHFDGRNDGLSWPLENGPRQTPNLAVPVDQTAPVTWTSNVASVRNEAQITSEGRMGGIGLSEGDAAAISAFVNQQREVDLPGRTGDAAAISRGEALFNRADVGCSGCHTGALYTDNLSHDLYGLTAVNTPGLRGVAYTGPYLHDGSVATLEDLLEQIRSGVMGDTSMLSASEMDDLLAYLKSL